MMDDYYEADIVITREIGQLDGCFQKNKTKRKDREKGKKSRSLKGVV